MTWALKHLGWHMGKNKKKTLKPIPSMATKTLTSSQSFFTVCYTKPCDSWLLCSCYWLVFVLVWFWINFVESFSGVFVDRSVRVSVWFVLNPTDFNSIVGSCYYLSWSIIVHYSLYLIDFSRWLVVSDFEAYCLNPNSCGLGFLFLFIVRTCCS